MQGEAFDLLRDCVTGLDEKYRVLIEGFYFHDMTVRELAQGHNLSEGSVRVSMYRARHLLAECLKKKGAIKQGD